MTAPIPGTEEQGNAAGGPVLDGALPSHMIDLIRDGVTPEVLRREGSKAVWKALVSTAASAQQRGWTWGRWIELVDDPVRSDLARQNHQNGRGGRRTDAARMKTLSSAWEKAERWLSTAEPAFTKQGAADRAVLLATESRLFMADHPGWLKPREKVVLEFFLDRATDLGSDKITASRDVIVAGVPFGRTAVDTALLGLEERRALTLAVRGRRRTKGKKGQASVFHLQPTTLWVNPVSGAPAVVSGAPGCGAPTVSGAPIGGDEVVSGAPRPITFEEIASILGAEAAQRVADRRRRDRDSHIGE